MEVCGDAAAYFDPYSIDSMRNQIEKVIYNKELKEQLRTKGAEQLAHFSMEKSAEKTIDVYRKFC